MNRMSRRPIVSVIGDARLAEGDNRLTLARHTGCHLVDYGFTVMTGGMGGVMHSAMLGGRESENWTSGCTIGLIPGTDPDHPQISNAADLVIPTGLDHARNLIVAQSDAVIAIGGGAGTLSEMAFAWTHKRLLVAMRCEGWSGRLADEPIDGRSRYPEIPDDSVYGASSPEEAVKLVKKLVPLYQRRHRNIAK